MDLASCQRQHTKGEVSSYPGEVIDFLAGETSMNAGAKGGNQGCGAHFGTGDWLKDRFTPDRFEGAIRRVKQGSNDY